VGLLLWTTSSARVNQPSRPAYLALLDGREVSHRGREARVTLRLSLSQKGVFSPIRVAKLSELGIEKVIVELNGFRQRTVMLKEEIGKISRALTERAGQLNDLVAKNLRDLREQLGGSTLSGYLALQGKMTQGEIGEQEYNMQRDYFKNELQGMIRRLDETRKLMMIMAQLDSRPSPPGTQNPTPR